MPAIFVWFPWICIGLYLMLFKRILKCASLEPCFSQLDIKPLLKRKKKPTNKQTNKTNKSTNKQNPQNHLCFPHPAILLCTDVLPHNYHLGLEQQETLAAFSFFLYAPKESNNKMVRSHLQWSAEPVKLVHKKSEKLASHNPIHRQMSVLFPFVG